jgi:hypothetical protein
VFGDGIKSCNYCEILPLRVLAKSKITQDKQQQKDINNSPNLLTGHVSRKMKKDHSTQLRMKSRWRK